MWKFYSVCYWNMSPGWYASRFLSENCPAFSPFCVQLSLLLYFDIEKGHLFFHNLAEWTSLGLKSNAARDPPLGSSFGGLMFSVWYKAFSLVNSTHVTRFLLNHFWAMQSMPERMELLAQQSERCLSRDDISTSLKRKSRLT